MEEISRELESLTVDLQANKEMLQVFETAGIQLYPRLNWSRLGRLRARLLEAIPAPASPWKDCFDLLSDLHRRAEEQFTAQMNNVVARIWNKGKGVGPREDLRLRNMLDDLDFRRRFLPLSAAAMKELLRIEKGDAAQRRSRYRKELPDLLPRLGDFYSELGDFGQFDDSLMFDQYEDEA